MDEVEFTSGGNTGGAHYSISDNGTLVKSRDSGTSSAGGTQLIWVSNNDTQEAVSPDRRDYSVGRISPSGQHIAVQVGFLGSRRLLIVNAIRGIEEHDLEDAGMPVWSPDGDAYIYGSGSNIMSGRISDSEAVDTVLSLTGILADPTDWSRDGRYILYNAEPPGGVGTGVTSIHYLDTELGATAPFLRNDVDIDYARFSPDGKWLVYEFGPPGNSQVIIQRFPGGESRQVVSDFGQKPMWRTDGEAVFYSDRTGQIVEAELDLDEGSVGSTSIVSSLSTTGFGFFDIHPEDGRVLVFSAGSSSNSTSTTPNRLILDVVVNWTGTLPKLHK